MAEYAALPLFTDAYMADTRHLTAAQHGAYILLLMTAWRMPDCKLPDDDQFLSRCASMDLRTWKANRHIVMAFWRLDDEQKWSQQRLLDERKYVTELRSKNVAAGKASALKRLNRGSTSVATKTQPKPNPHTHTPIRKDKGKPLPFLACERFDDFKMIYPKQRAGSWQKAREAYLAAIKRGATEEQIYNGVLGYANSDEVVRGFAKGAAAWLNDDRFMNNYSTEVKNGNAITRANTGQPESAHRNQGAAWQQDHPTKTDRAKAAVQRGLEMYERDLAERRSREAKAAE